MKRILTLIIALTPLLASAITLTQTDKQEALNAATQFCNLLTRYCNGERTLTTQINSLCSGADCSAFDDLKLNKEVTLRNYLLTIQKLYPSKLPTVISTPSLNNCNIVEEPSLSMSECWGSVGGSQLSTNVMVELENTNAEDYFFVFKVNQNYPTLNKTTNKFIIYSIKNKKITAYISTSGSYISWLNGLLEFCEKKYASAAAYFESAAAADSAGRGSLKTKCYMLALVCYIYTGNTKKAAEMADYINDPFYSPAMHLQDCITSQDWTSAYRYAKALEESIAKNSEIDTFALSNLYMMLANFYFAPFHSYQNLQKTVQYIRMANRLGLSSAGYMLYIYSTLINLTEETDVTYDELFSLLYASADAGYPPAFYIKAHIKEIAEDTDAAIYWFRKSAESGNPVAWARLGRLLKNANRKDEARKCLQNALAAPKLEETIKDIELTFGQCDWPQSRADVQTMLNSLTPPPTPSYSSPSNSSTYISNSSHSSGSSHNSYQPSYSSSSSHHSRRKFNAPKDEISGGFSFGYVQKQWVFKADGQKETVGMFEGQNYVNGIQAGIRLTPQIDYGFAFNLGLYYEHYFADSEHLFDEYGEYWFKYREHSLYLPIHLKYDLNFSKWFQLSVYGGLGLDCGLSGKVSICDDEGTYDSESVYAAEYNQKRFNASYEYGAAIRIKHVQFDIVASKGFVNMSGDDSYKAYQNKRFNLNISLMF